MKKGFDQAGPNAREMPSNCAQPSTEGSSALSGRCNGEGKSIVLSRAIYPKRRGRRPFTALAILSIITGLLVTGGTVLAVHDETFQLDGDTSAATTTNVGATTQTVDWSSIFTAAGVPVASLPTGFEDAAFKKDFNNTGSTFLTNDTSTFATGSKDTLPIAGWQCNFDNNVNSKIDVMNAYAVAYDGCGRRRDHLLRARAEHQHRRRERGVLVPPGRGRLHVDRWRRRLHRRARRRRPAGRVRVHATVATSARSTSTAGTATTRPASLNPTPDRHRRRLPGTDDRFPTTMPARRPTPPTSRRPG